MSTRQRFIGAAILFFAVWTAATWFFEGRIETLLRPDATVDRIVYAFVVNLLFGLGGGIVLLWFARRAAPETETIGFGSLPRARASIAIGLVLGGAAYVLQGAPSLHPVVIANAFAQVFVVSAAEVVVCWAIVGAAVAAGLRRHGAVVAGIGASVVASVLFGVYHYAHSAPFNTLPMVALLSVVGLFTSAFFFLSRDIAGTVVFHNFLGTFGVVQALAAANSLAPFERLQPSLIGTAVLGAAVLAAGYVVLRRRARHSGLRTSMAAHSS